jgi:serine/threonine protein kinase
VYIHSLGIVHRDLKLENLMLSRKGSITEGLKIVDFGLARFNAPFDEDDMCGTPLYVAPEVVGAPGPGGTKGAAAVTIAVDTWAAGVILYMLLSGAAPFMHSDDDMLFSMIRKGVLSFADRAWAPVSDGAKALIAALVVVKPEGRLTADAARHHAWFGADVPVCQLAAAQDGLRKLAARRKFKGAVKHIVAAQRMHSIVRNSSSMSAGDGNAPRVGGGADAAAAAS